MTNNEHKGKPGWVVKRIALNLGARHAEMLDALLRASRETDHRANNTTVLENAIALAYSALVK